MANKYELEDEIRVTIMDALQYNNWDIDTTEDELYEHIDGHIPLYYSNQQELLGEIPDIFTADADLGLLDRDANLHDVISLFIRAYVEELASKVMFDIREEFAGFYHKCPSCERPLSADAVECPACKSEIFLCEECDTYQLLGDRDCDCEEDEDELIDYACPYPDCKGEISGAYLDSCPKCERSVVFDPAGDGYAMPGEAQEDEEAKLYACPHCEWKFAYNGWKHCLACGKEIVFSPDLNNYTKPSETPVSD